MKTVVLCAGVLGAAKALVLCLRCTGSSRGGRIAEEPRAEVGVVVLPLLEYLLQLPVVLHCCVRALW